MELTIPTIWLTHGAEVLLGGGLSALTCYSLNKLLMAPVVEQVETLKALPSLLGKELNQFDAMVDELGVKMVATAEGFKQAVVNLANAQELQGQLITAVQQAQVQLATSDSQQEAALIDLAERVNRQSEILGRLVEQLERRPANPMPPRDPWAAPDLADRIAGLQREFNQRRQSDVQAMQIPTPEAE